MTMLKWNIRQRFIYSWRHTKYHHNERMRNAIECSKEIYVYKSSIRYILFNILLLTFSPFDGVLCDIRTVCVWASNELGKSVNSILRPHFVELKSFSIDEKSIFCYPSSHRSTESENSIYYWHRDRLENDFQRVYYLKVVTHLINIHYEDLYTHLFFFFFHFFLR